VAYLRVHRSTCLSPKGTVQWKFTARRFGNGVYSTPANQVVEYQINDPRGTKVSEGKSTLNAFGSAWGSLELSEQLPLGEYNIQFWDQDRKTGIGSAKLFRLEEYKLPEFKVAVKTPEENGKKKAFRLGEKVEVNIQADYYLVVPSVTPRLKSSFIKTLSITTGIRAAIIRGTTLTLKPGEAGSITAVRARLSNAKLLRRMRQALRFSPSIRRAKITIRTSSIASRRA